MNDLEINAQITFNDCEARPVFRFENDFSNMYQQNTGVTFVDPSADLRKTTAPFDPTPIYGNNDRNYGYSGGNNLAGSKCVSTTIKVHPRVVINVATAYIQGGFSVDQLMTGWQKQGASVGVREYYGVNVWDRDLPGKGRGANLTYLQQTIPHFHDNGARFMSAAGNFTQRRSGTPISLPISEAISSVPVKSLMT